MKALVELDLCQFRRHPTRSINAAHAGSWESDLQSRSPTPAERDTLAGGLARHPPFKQHIVAAMQLQQSGSLSVVKSRVLGSVSSGSVVLYEVRDYPAS